MKHFTPAKDTVVDSTRKVSIFYASHVRAGGGAAGFKLSMEIKRFGKQTTGIQTRKISELPGARPRTAWIL